MKKITGFTLAVMLSVMSFAQITMSNAQFESLNEEQKALYLRIKTADSLRTVRVNDYLNVNITAKRTFIGDNGAVHVLTDIIGNKPIYTTTDNAAAAKAVGTDHLQVGGSLGLDLDGAGITVGVWDGGPIQDTHVEFQDQPSTSSRIFNVEFTNTDGSANQSNHGTHVTGTILAKGVNAEAKGMAPAAMARNYNFLNDSPEMVIEATAATPIFLSNHSYGVPVPGPGAWFMGAYSSGAVEVDDIARANPHYLMVFSAGNSGNTDYTGGLFFNRDKLTGDKTAKNNLVVANAAPRPIAFSDDLIYEINSSSSQGPTDDLRIKPDIAGDGTGLISPVTGDSYGNFTGTSMAAPNVTGSLVLLQQYYNQLNGNYMNAASLKGLAIHTARDDDEITGPDPVFGWGVLDAERAAQTITAANNDLAIIEELTLVNGATYVLNFVAQAGEKLSATICWTDIKGFAVSGVLNDPTPVLVNDLDLRLSKDGVTFLPWRFDFSPGSGIISSKADNVVDNVERIDIELPEAGNYRLVVSHKGNLQSAVAFGSTDQDFSLIVTGANVSLSTDDTALSNSFILFPNPTQDNVTISFDARTSEDIKVNVYDLGGRLIYSNSYDNNALRFKETLDVQNFKSGVYLVEILEGTNKATKKLIID